MRRKVTLVLILLVSIVLGEELKRERHDIPYKGEQELDVSIAFGLGRLNIKNCTDENYLLRSEMIYSHEYYRPNVVYKVLANRGRLRLETKKFAKDEVYSRDKSRRYTDKNTWDLEFTTKIPSTYEIDLGLGEGLLNFSNIRLQDLRLQCGLSDVKMNFNVANQENLRTMNVSTGLGSVEIRGLGYANMERFDIECGLGATSLYFDGKTQQDARGKVRVGLGSVKIIMPDDVAVEVRAESSFLSSLDLRGFDRVGEKIYRSGNWRSAKRKIYMEIEVGLGSVDFQWLD